MNKAVRRGVRLVILESSEGQFALVQVRDGRWVSGGRELQFIFGQILILPGLPGTGTYPVPVSKFICSAKYRVIILSNKLQPSQHTTPISYALPQQHSSYCFLHSMYSSLPALPLEMEPCCGPCNQHRTIQPHKHICTSFDPHSSYRIHAGRCNCLNLMGMLRCSERNSPRPMQHKQLLNQGTQFAPQISTHAFFCQCPSGHAPFSLLFNSTPLSWVAISQL